MKTRNKSLLYILLLIIILLQSCAPQVVRKQPTPPDECQPPPPDIFTAAGVDLKFAQAIFKKIVLGSIDIKTNPEVITLASKAAIDERIREYIRCLAIKKEGFTHAQAAYLERLYAFMRTNPTPEQFIEWQKNDPFPDNNPENTQNLDVEKVKIHRILPLVNENEQFVGYETLIVNNGATDAWIDFATLFVTAVLFSSCSGDLNVFEKYYIRIMVKEETIHTFENSISKAYEIGGTIADNKGAKHRVDGTLEYTDDCNKIKWNFNIYVPINVYVPAKGQASLNLIFEVVEVQLIQRKVSGTFYGRYQYGGPEETDTLCLVLRGGYELEKSFEGELFQTLINSLSKKLYHQDNTE